MKKSFFFLILVSLLLTFSCGGGGSSSGGGTGVNSSPAISNLVGSPTQITLNQGGGAITMTLTFDWFDSGGDLSSGTSFYYDANGVLKSDTKPIQGVTGVTSGTLMMTLIIPTTTRGTTTGGVYVTDSGGRESNRLTGSYTIS